MSFTFKETEDKITEYYRSLKILGGLRHKLEVYRKRKADIESKIENSVIELSADFSAVKYDMTGSGSSGFKSSQQEKAVDRAFSVLKKNLVDVNDEILFIEEQINNIEAENAGMEYILNGIKKEHREVMDYIYKYKRGTLKASMDLHLGRATIYRKKEEVIKDVMKYLNYYF